MKIKKEMFVYLDKYIPGEYILHACDMADYGYVLVDTVMVEVEFSLPDAKELVLREVKMLEKKQAEINGKAYAESKEIQDKIDSLLCIEYKKELP